MKSFFKNLLLEILETVRLAIVCSVAIGILHLIDALFGIAGVIITTIIVFLMWWIIRAYHETKKERTDENN